MQEIIRKDLRHVWHPFTHLKYAETPVNIIKSEGAYYFSDDGRKIIDAISSWWVNLHGHCHPYISEQVSRQLQTNEHSIFSGFTHPGAVTLAERLLKHLPAGQERIFFSDDGSTSVEVALKMALQYWYNKGDNRRLFIAFENAYHGDTFGGMSVGARNVFNQAFSSQLFDVVHIPIPASDESEDYFEQFEKMLRHHVPAAFIFEPLVQGAAGMQMYEARHLNRLMQLCRKHEVIRIADEVMTGFGRTGKFFANDYLEEKADITCISKGLTGGYMPLGITSCAGFIYEAYLSEDKTKTFFHGHSYTANPTACAAALASLDLMEKQDTANHIFRIQGLHENYLRFFRKFYPHIPARSLGTILAFEIPAEGGTHYLNPLGESISSFFMSKNILIRPLGNVLYLVPPYCISNHDLEYIYSCISEFFSA